MMTPIHIIKGPDERGRFYHWRFRWATYHPGHPDGEHRGAWRAQIFLAPLPENWCAVGEDGPTWKKSVT